MWQPVHGDCWELPALRWLRLLLPKYPPNTRLNSAHLREPSATMNSDTEKKKEKKKQQNCKTATMNSATGKIKKKQEKNKNNKTDTMQKQKTAPTSTEAQEEPCRAHCDPGLLTVLCRSSGRGLEAQRPIAASCTPGRPAAYEARLPPFFAAAAATAGGGGGRKQRQGGVVPLICVTFLVVFLVVVEK